MPDPYLTKLCGHCYKKASNDPAVWYSRALANPFCGLSNRHRHILCGNSIFPNHLLEQIDERHREEGVVEAGRQAEKFKVNVATNANQVRED